MTIGYADGSSSRFLNDDLLASTKGGEPVTVVIDTVARDANSPEGDTVLRKGLVLCRLDSNGKYKEWDADASDGSQDEATALVLAHEVRHIDDADQVATAYMRGNFNSDKLYLDESAQVLVLTPTVVNDWNYTLALSVNGVTYNVSYLADPTATAQEIVEGLKADFDAKVPAAVVAASEDDTALTLTGGAEAMTKFVASTDSNQTPSGASGGPFDWGKVQRLKRTISL